MNLEIQDRPDMSDRASKVAAYRLLAEQTQALLAGERDALANLAQFAALVDQSLADLNWAGFYLVRGRELVLGPFQGKVACVRIPFGRGVCGTCAETGQVQIVADVHAFDGHIACDSASQSELVLPLRVGADLIAVFDLDSPRLARFDADDATGLATMLGILSAGTDWHPTLFGHAAAG